MRRVVLGFVAGFLLAFVFLCLPAQASGAFRWTNVGGDPCNPKAGCTLEWALGKSGWPKEAQLGLLVVVKTVPPETIAITSGQNGSKDSPWRGWMTWGKYKPRFEANVIAAWPDGQYHPAFHWTYRDGDTLYHLIRVRTCGNWGGWITELPKQKAEVPAPSGPADVVERFPPPPKMPLGVIPVVACL